MTLIPQRDTQPRANMERLVKWVDKDDTTVTMGILRAPYYIHAVHIHVTEAFDGSGTDTIVVGHSGDTDAFSTATNVESIGVKSPTLGANNGYNGTSYTVDAVLDSTNATTGKALVVLEYWRVPQSP